MASIHPIEQLEPIDIPFNLVIIQLLRDDDGINLPELIEITRSKLGTGNSHKTHFEDVLLAGRYRDRDSASYEGSRYSPALEIRLPINDSANVLYPAVINSNVNYADVRWRLRSSDHPFIDTDDAFWKGPSL
jgi:hypothetical protein